MKVKIKTKKVETEEIDEQQLEEAWYDAVGAAAGALNPVKGVAQKVGKFVQDARGASLEADAKRQIAELIKLMDSVAPKFQTIVDRATKLYGGDMRHPMVGAILNIKKNITTHRNALQSLTTKPLLQQNPNRPTTPAAGTTPAQPAQSNQTQQQTSPGTPAPAAASPNQPTQSNQTSTTAPATAPAANRSEKEEIEFKRLSRLDPAHINANSKARLAKLTKMGSYQPRRRGGSGRKR